MPNTQHRAWCVLQAIHDAALSNTPLPHILCVSGAPECAPTATVVPPSYAFVFTNVSPDCKLRETGVTLRVQH